MPSDEHPAPPGIHLVPGATAPGASLIQNVPGAVYRTAQDPRRTVTFVSRQVHAVTGHRPDAFNTGRLGLMDIVHPDDRHRLRSALSELASTDGGALEIEYRVIHAEGGVRWVLDRGQVTTSGGAPCLDGMLEDVTDRRRTHDELAWLALHDPLTGLANRRALEDRLAMETDRHDRTGATFSVVAVDIDHFKAVNDTHGHEAGDRAIVEVGRRLQGGIRAIDLAARAGGEEFVLLLADTPLREALAVAERLRVAVAGEAVPGVGTITISAGVAQCTGLQARETLAVADAALYRAKASGRNRVVAAPPGAGPSPAAA
ncbi:MAG: sensor domain-containing diguanylate cyclase [Thermoleophilia bacterium]|nr:sensor domain-containing diguanylate cyclase [Thermoleophilia bacterium]